MGFASSRALSRARHQRKSETKELAESLLKEGRLVRIEYDDDGYVKAIVFVEDKVRADALDGPNAKVLPT